MASRLVFLFVLVCLCVCVACLLVFFGFELEVTLRKLYCCIRLFWKQLAPGSLPVLSTIRIAPVMGKFFVSQ